MFTNVVNTIRTPLSSPRLHKGTESRPRDQKRPCGPGMRGRVMSDLQPAGPQINGTPVLPHFDPSNPSHLRRTQEQVLVEVLLERARVLSPQDQAIVRAVYFSN